MGRQVPLYQKHEDDMPWQTDWLNPVQEVMHWNEREELPVAIHSPVALGQGSPRVRDANGQYAQSTTHLLRQLSHLQLE